MRECIKSILEISNVHLYSHSSFINKTEPQCSVPLWPNWRWSWSKSSDPGHGTNVTGLLPTAVTILFFSALCLIRTRTLLLRFITMTMFIHSHTQHGLSPTVDLWITAIKLINVVWASHYCITSPQHVQCELNATIMLTTHNINTI